MLVEHCDIECNDDALCLKAGRDADGLRVNRPSEHLVFRDNTVRGGAAGITIGSETSGGIRDVDVSGLKVMRGVPAGVLFKSASTRGGTIEDIRIHGVEMEGVPRPISITMNWNPSYSYATAPADMKDVPSYWKILLQPVTPERGLPHFRNIKISDIKARDAQQAFAVSAYPQATLADFVFSNIDIESKSAGSIQEADSWTFTDTRIKTADGSKVDTTKSKNVKGL